jgi:hypothetical protein
MSETPFFLVARILGISSSVFLSGFAFSASYYGLPAIALSPFPVRLQQWQVIYDLGKLVSPPVSATSALLWGYSAWSARDNEDSLEWKLYAMAGLATFSVLAWTVGVMMPTNLDLIRRAKIAKEVTETVVFGRESVEILARWSWMNYVRGVLPMAGAWVGLYAALR